MAPSSIGEERKAVGWNHVRLSVVVPIGVIVAVAIVCVVVAVLGSAQRADEVALETERQLFTRALANHGERVLREIESVATSGSAARRIRAKFDPDWVQRRVGRWLETYFDHDFVFVADASDRLIYALARPPQRRSELVQHDPAGRDAGHRSAARTAPAPAAMPPGTSSLHRARRCCRRSWAAPPSSRPWRSSRPTTRPNPPTSRRRWC